MHSSDTSQINKWIFKVQNISSLTHSTRYGGASKDAKGRRDEVANSQLRTAYYHTTDPGVMSLDRLGDLSFCVGTRLEGWCWNSRLSSYQTLGVTFQPMAKACSHRHLARLLLLEGDTSEGGNFCTAWGLRTQRGFVQMFSLDIFEPNLGLRLGYRQQYEPTTN